MKCGPFAITILFEGNLISFIKIMMKKSANYFCFLKKCNKIVSDQELDPWCPNSGPPPHFARPPPEQDQRCMFSLSGFFFFSPVWTCNNLFHLSALGALSEKNKSVIAPALSHFKVFPAHALRTGNAEPKYLNTILERVALFNPHCLLPFLHFHLRRRNREQL